MARLTAGEQIDSGLPGPAGRRSRRSTSRCVAASTAPPWASASRCSPTATWCWRPRAPASDALRRDGRAARGGEQLPVPGPDGLAAGGARSCSPARGSVPPTPSRPASSCGWCPTATARGRGAGAGPAGGGGAARGPAVDQGRHARPPATDAVSRRPGPGGRGVRRPVHVRIATSPAARSTTTSTPAARRRTTTRSASRRPRPPRVQRGRRPARAGTAAARSAPGTSRAARRARLVTSSQSQLRALERRRVLRVGHVLGRPAEGGELAPPALASPPGPARGRRGR